MWHVKKRNQYQVAGLAYQFTQWHFWLATSLCHTCSFCVLIYFLSPFCPVVQVRLRSQKGIPPALRGRAWLYLSGGKVKREQNQGKFQVRELLISFPPYSSLYAEFDLKLWLFTRVTSSFEIPADLWPVHFLNWSIYSRKWTVVQWLIIKLKPFLVLLNTVLLQCCYCAIKRSSISSMCFARSWTASRGNPNGLMWLRKTSIDSFLSMRCLCRGEDTGKLCDKSHL